jgi:hypothetical protein
LSDGKEPAIRLTTATVYPIYYLIKYYQRKTAAEGIPEQPELLLESDEEEKEESVDAIESN